MMPPDPIYRQIADDLRTKIETGELRPGEQLKTELDLREEYSASRNTIRDAIKWLITRGLVETRPGQGTFVTEKIDPFVTTLTGDPTQSGLSDETIYLAEVQASGRVPKNSSTRVEIQEADAVIADALRIDEGASVVVRHQQRFLDGTPFSLLTSYYPMTLVQKGAVRLIQAADIEEGAVEYLKNELGIAQVGYRDSIAVRAPDANETTFFKLPDDGRVSVYQIFRVGFDASGDRLRLTVTIYPADRNRFLVKVGKVPAMAEPATGGGQHAPPAMNEAAG
jgi:GntR family transcriptional regulator